jgi:protein disulfide-isomerase A6
LSCPHLHLPLHPLQRLLPALHPLKWQLQPVDLLEPVLCPVARTSGNSPALLKASQPALVLFYADFCGHCKQMMPDFEQAAEEASSKTGVIIAKIESGKLKDMASVSSQLPAINGFPTMCTNYEGNGIQAHVGRKDRAAIQAVIQKASAVRMAARANMAMGKIAARQMIEFASMQDACAALKGKNKVVMAYADWCGHCKAMKADYESLVDKAPAGVMVGRLNSNAIKPGQMCEGVEEIKAFPTILYNNGSKIVKVMGRQSLQALMDLLKK